MTTERGDDYVRVEGDERLDIPDFMAASSLPGEAIWRLAGAIFGSADGVLTAAPLSWDLAASGAGGSTVTLSKMLLYGGNPDSPGVDNDSSSYLPSGFVLAYDPAGDVQVSMQNTVNFAAGQAAGKGTSVWWSRSEVAADLGNRRKYNGPSSKEMNEALLTRYRQAVTFATVVGDVQFESPPAIPGRTWHRLFHVAFAIDGGEPTVFWASPMDYWLSPAGADGYSIARLLDGGAYDHTFTDATGGHGFHLTVSRVIRWIANQMLRTRDSRSNTVDHMGGGTAADESTGVDFYAIDRGVIQLDEALAAIESGSGAPGALPPLAYVGLFQTGESESAIELWSSSSLETEITVSRKSTDLEYYYEVDDFGGLSWVAMNAVGMNGNPVMIRFTGDNVYQVAVIKGITNRDDVAGALTARYEHTGHLVFIYGKV